MISADLVAPCLLTADCNQRELATARQPVGASLETLASKDALSIPHVDAIAWRVVDLDDTVVDASVSPWDIHITQIEAAACMRDFDHLLASQPCFASVGELGACFDSNTGCDAFSRVKHDWCLAGDGKALFIDCFLRVSARRLTGIACK